MTTRYVSTLSGNDSWDGLSELTAKKTLSAITLAAVAGDVIVILGGLYYKEYINAYNKDKLRFKAKGRVVIDGGGSLDYCVSATGTNYVYYFEGIEFRNPKLACLYMANNYVYTNFKNCTFSCTGQFYQGASFERGGRHYRIKGCTLYGLSDWIYGAAGHQYGQSHSSLASNFSTHSDAGTGLRDYNACVDSSWRGTYGIDTDHYPPPFKDVSSYDADFSLDSTKFDVVVVTGENDKFSFDEGGAELTATIAAGTYTTGTALATAIKTAMDAAGALTYTVSYSATTGRITISAPSNFTLRFGTGTDRTYDVITLLMGFDRIDMSGASTQSGRWQVGAYAVYMRAGSDFIRCGASGEMSILFSNTWDDDADLDDNAVWGDSVNDTSYYDPAWPTGGLVVTASNQWIDFDEGGAEISVQVATGTYTSGASLAAAIEVAMDGGAVADITGAWNTSTHRFDTSSAGATLNMLWKTGTHGSDNTDTHIGTLIGYLDTADDTGATLYSADSATTEERVNGTPAAKSAISWSTGTAAIDKNIEPSATSARFITPVMDLDGSRGIYSFSWSGTEGGASGSWIDNSPSDVDRECEFRADAATFNIDAAAGTTTPDWTLIRRDEQPSPAVTKAYLQSRFTLQEAAQE